MLDEELNEHSKTNFFLEHKTPLLIIVLILCVSVLGVLLHSAHDHQKQMEKQLANYEELVDALRNKTNANVEESKETTPVITSETVKSQLKALHELATYEYIYTNADKRESSEKWLFGWERPFSGKSILVTYDGTIKAGIDLNESTVDVNEEAHKIIITLPDSKIISNEIPQESISIVEVKNGLFNDVTFDNYNDFISEQKAVMEQKAIDRGILEKADEEAKALIESSLEALPGMGAYTLVIK